MAKLLLLIQVGSRSRFRKWYVSQLDSVGISHAYGGVLSALSIHYTLTPVSGTKNKWVEKETVSALYPDRQQIIVVESREIEL
jgi:hypothetical protein